MATIYTPDYWKIVRFSTPRDGGFFKIFATWAGPYADPDVWKFSSGGEVFEVEEYVVNCPQASGSTYVLLKKREGVVPALQHVLDTYMRQLAEAGHDVRIINNPNFEDMK